jgi:protein-tyrosine phosphatase
MFDLHSHVLPGIDDGARDLQEAAAMCRMAAEDGCQALAATPHQRRGSWWNTDAARLAELRERLQEAVGDALSIHPGGEIHVDSDLLGEIERIPESGILPLAGSRYLLLEFNGHERPRDGAHLVHELRVAGWRPIVAHPEFIPWLADDPDAVARLVDLGATVQVTAMSVTGDFGRSAMLSTHALLAAGLVHFVASDCHDTRNRPPGLKRAYRTLAGRWGEETARRLTIDNPRAVLEGREIPGRPAPGAPEA